MAVYLVALEKGKKKLSEVYCINITTAYKRLIKTNKEDIVQQSIFDKCENEGLSPRTIVDGARTKKEAVDVALENWGVLRVLEGGKA